MSLIRRPLLIACLGLLAACGAQGETGIYVDATRSAAKISPYLTGACLEDVNHEIYGGLYSQMVFGESFQEPAAVPAIAGFRAFGGTWTCLGEELRFQGSPGDKLISELPAFADGEIGCEIFMADRSWSNAGLLVRVGRASHGVDAFDGYEITLNAAAQVVRLGRHRQDWNLIRDEPCPVPTNTWIPLVVNVTGRRIEIQVAGNKVLVHEDNTPQALAQGTLGLRAFQTEARFRNLWVKTGQDTRPIPFRYTVENPPEVSGAWDAVRNGAVAGSWSLIRNSPFHATQSQRITFDTGSGMLGIANPSLNRWGMNFVSGRRYEGVIWARAERTTTFHVALESADGARVYAESRLTLDPGQSEEPGGWQGLEFGLRPNAADPAGRLRISLQTPGALDLGYVMLQPGEWGRFKGLPVRRDVAKALIDQGITVLRYGGSMVNHREYRWKNMTGPRDRRTPYRGTWYPHSSNGWGIPDFLDFCSAAGFLAIPAFNMGETAQDMADFVEYANGSADTPWGARRARDGRTKPYNLRHIQLGNEERVDEAYYEKFKVLAEAIWAKDPRIIVVVGDFVYGQRITDPFAFRGAHSGITTLAAHKKILDLARAHDREVWFDVHVVTDGPRPDTTLGGMFSFLDALGGISDGANFKVAVFEFNAGNHSQRRALANALAIQAIARDGRIPVATSANCLQPDGQNDNGWDQGLLFLNPSSVWLQPPGHVTRMISRNYRPALFPAEVRGGTRELDVFACGSEKGEDLVLQVVNAGPDPVPASIVVRGLRQLRPRVAVETLAAPLDARNSARDPRRASPTRTVWRPDFSRGAAAYTFEPWSFTVIRFP